MDLPVIPGYTLKKPLGKGGMAVVYLAEQDNFQRPVALKIMAKHLESDPSFGERFMREARICAQLSHPNIVAIYDVGQYESYRYMAMEVLTGGDLKVKMKQGLPIHEGIDIVRGIAAGLDYAHQKNFIHRDIKPENILFKGDGTPVISDFGIARDADSKTQMTKTGTVIGSPHYMSPEQAEAAQLDSRSDLYSLGIILYEMLTGRVPFKGESAISIGIKHITAPVPPLPPQVANFQDFIDKALAKEREDRFQTGAELIEALDNANANFDADDAATVVLSEATAIPPGGKSAAADDGGATQVRQPTAAAPARKSRGKMGLTVATAAIVVALIGGGAWYYQQYGLPGFATASSQPSGLSPEETALLQKAGLAVSEQRYYSPPGNNAQFFLTTLLTRRPDSAQAQAALDRLLDTYLREAENAIGNGDYDRANAFLNQGSQLTFYIQDSALLDRLSRMRAQVNAATQ